MKYCPTCGTRYDEEILRFCMKDGTPLLDEEQPNFVAMPSESFEEPVDEDDPSEHTVIRRNVPVPPPPAEDFESKATPSQRIVVPTYNDPQPPRPGAAHYQAPPRKSNTAMVVFLTIIGTVAVLAVAGAGIWFLSRDNANNTNRNANANQENTNLNTNLGISDFDFNVNANANVNTNANANLKTPTPTPKPTPSATPTVSPSPTDSPDDDNDNTSPSPVPSPTRPAASPTPRSTTSPPANLPVNGGVLNSRAVSLPVPTYPQIARQVRAAGQVSVQVLVDENGNVTSARAINGHPLLRPAAEAAARQARIAPVRVGDRNVRATGVLLYNFRSN